MSGRSRTSGTRTALSVAAAVATVLALVAALLGASPAVANDSADIGSIGNHDYPGLSSVDDLDGLDPSIAARAQGLPQLDALQSEDGLVLVEVLTTETTAIAAEIEALGGTVEGISDGLAVHAELNQLQLAEAQALDGVLGVIPALPIGNNRGEVRGEQVAKIGAARWHQAGTTGAGVKIVIIDNFGGDTYRASLASGDVPRPERTLCRNSGQNCDIWSVTGEDQAHGVGVAEVIHELAPSAELYLATILSVADFNLAVNWAISLEADIISWSQGPIAFTSPGDGRGTLNAAAAKAAANGITVFAAAGNAGGSEAAGRSGTYYRGRFTDTDGDGLHEFAPGDESLGFFACAGGLISARWNDFTDVANRFQFSATNATDYDIISVDLNGNIVSAGAALQGAPGQLPFEFAQGSNCATGEPGQLFVQRFADGNGANDIIEIKVGTGALEYWQDRHSAAVQVVDSFIPGVIGVGAVDPALGRNIAVYSSQGPTTDGRTTPVVSAASCVQTVAFGNACFNGTSAATPAVAGFGALVLSARLARTPAQLEAFLTRHAVDRGARGVDSVFGFGEVIAPTAPCGGRLATIVGTAQGDNLRGTSRADVIVGFNGNDTIRGGGGNDTICGNAGTDRIIGGAGANDVCFSNSFGLPRDAGRITGCKTTR